MTEQKKEFPLEEAKGVANDVIVRLWEYAEKIEVVGSIRRKKPLVHDIDIVAIPKFMFFNKIHEGLPEAEIKTEGKALVRFDYRGIQVDIYIAKPQTYEVIRLIRTGSEQHNIRLCVLAKSRGLKLFANGDGLWNQKAFKKISDTEDGILKELLGKVPPPEERE